MPCPSGEIAASKGSSSCASVWLTRGWDAEEQVPSYLWIYLCVDTTEYLFQYALTLWINVEGRVLHLNWLKMSISLKSLFDQNFWNTCHLTK